MNNYDVIKTVRLTEKGIEAEESGSSESGPGQGRQSSGSGGETCGQEINRIWR